MGRLLLDSANLGEIRAIAGTSAVAGVTTNPSLMAREERGDYVERLREIAGIVGKGKHLSVEVTTDENLFDEACLLWERVHTGGVDLHVKVPVSLANLGVVTRLAAAGVKVNCTACMTWSQAKLASEAGAQIVSFFWNRMRDGGNENPADEVDDYVHSTDETRAEIICGSIRTVDDVVECWAAGAQYVTVPMKILTTLLSHPETDKAVARFSEEIKRWRG